MVKGGLLGYFWKSSFDTEREDPLWLVYFVWSDGAPGAAEEEEPLITTGGATILIVECRGGRNQGHQYIIQPLCFGELVSSPLLIGI